MKKLILIAALTAANISAQTDSIMGEPAERFAYANTASVMGEALPVVGGGYTPTTVVFDTSDYSGSIGLTTGDELIAAFRITRTTADGTGNAYIAADTISNTAIYISDVGDFIAARIENTQGTSTVLFSTTTIMQSETLSVLIKAQLTDVSTAVYELWINGALEDSDSSPVVDPSIRDIKMPLYINSTDGSGADSNAFKLTGGLWIANTGYGSLSYSDFFDGSDDPIFDSETISGVTAVFFQNGNAAAWNAGTNDGTNDDFTMNGSVSDE